MAATLALFAGLTRSDPLLNRSLTCRNGDVVEVAWECVDAATGEVIDSSSRGPMSRNISFQMGTDAGFQPKNGLKLAFNYACEGLMVGEVQPHPVHEHDHNVRYDSWDM